MLLTLPSGLTVSSPESVVVEAGQPAPFRGVLLPPEVAAELLATAETCIDQRAADLQLCEDSARERVLAETKRSTARVVACEARIRACESECRDSVASYDKELKICRSASWVPYATAVGGVILGGLTGAAVCAGR